MTNLEKQDLRHACRRALALRPRLHLGVSQVSQSARRLLPFTLELDDVGDALAFLVGLKHAEETPDPLGSEKLYKITPEGLLAHERSESA